MEYVGLLSFLTSANHAVSLRVVGIDNVCWNKKAFEHLMLPRSTKTLVSALVKTHEGAAAQEDVIAGKGNGVILLLHGGPGTGKTLTAGTCDIDLFGTKSTNYRF
jgi:DNA polymerase III delta prime subunit